MASDPYLVRINKALRQLGASVALDLTPNAQRLRLRATLPTPEGPWRQRRISTRLAYPQDIDAARVLAEQLGQDLLGAKAGLPFPFERWIDPDRALLSGEVISGREALKRTEQWWRSRRKRPGGDDGWRVDYANPLRHLQKVEAITPDTLKQVVQITQPGTRTRQRAANAAAAVAQALAMGPELVAELRALGRGYSTKNADPRDLPSNAAIETVIDGLPEGWQWVAGVCATYGTRPHEALLHSEVQASELLAVSAGKTGARQALPLPRAWVERWDLGRKRLPGVDLNRSAYAVGATLGIALRKRNAGFTGYDLRHAWAVRAILNPSISPSLAAKSMGHSVTIHSTTYQRWFDQQSMVGVLASL